MLGACWAVAAGREGGLHTPWLIELTLSTSAAKAAAPGFSRSATSGGDLGKDVSFSPGGGRRSPGRWSSQEVDQMAQEGWALDGNWDD